MDKRNGIIPVNKTNETNPPPNKEPVTLIDISLDEHALKKLGIQNCVPNIDSTCFTPSECLKTIENKLFFLGVSGRKWIKQGAHFDQFKETIERLKADADQNDIRFLLLHPSTHYFDELNGKDLPEIYIYENWKQLANTYKRVLQVRLYSHELIFRLQFVDGKEVAVSRYNNNSDPNGQSIPYLIFRKNAEYSLYDGFRRYFKLEWNKAMDIRKVNFSTQLNFRQ